MKNITSHLSFFVYIFASTISLATSETDIIKTIKTYLVPSTQAFDELATLVHEGSKHVYSTISYKAPSGIPLFDTFTELKNKIPYISLGHFPTHVTPCIHAQETFNIQHLYIKRDDQSGDNAYGGNKLRKLEFLYADALEYFKDAPPSARTIMTFGCAGSNHALATAIYAQKLGLKTILMLKDEWNSNIVRHNLLYDYMTGAQMNFAPQNAMRAIAALHEILKHKQEHGIFPYVIPTGGSNEIGALGYVNAALELKQQIDSGVMPEPDRIYVAAGSGGTYAGLLLGIKAAGLKSKVIGVMIEPEDLKKIHDNYCKLARDTNELLASADPTFPHMIIDEKDITLLNGFTGNDYALFTQEGMRAIKQLNNAEGIKLDGIYTGKAFSGLLNDVLKAHAEKEIILFWDTYSSYDFSEQIKGIDYHQLPKPFHKFFEEDVQALDI